MRPPLGSRIPAVRGHEELAFPKAARWEGVQSGYHRKFDDAEGASYLFWVGDDADATAFQNYLERHPGAVDLWLAGHTHTQPDDRYGGKSHIESRWGVTFANVSALTRHHVLSGRPLYPMSRLLTFESGRSEVRIQCYLHTTDHAAKAGMRRQSVWFRCGFHTAGNADPQVGLAGRPGGVASLRAHQLTARLRGPARF